VQLEYLRAVIGLRLTGTLIQWMRSNTHDLIMWECS
jgi:hypothetical protein